MIRTHGPNCQCERGYSFYTRIHWRCNLRCALLILAGWAAVFAAFAVLLWLTRPGGAA